VAGGRRALRAAVVVLRSLANYRHFSLFSLLSSAGMPYLDIIRDTVDRANVPVAVYQVRALRVAAEG
jgi:hypothetical protein